MNYMWEAFLDADEAGVDAAQVRFKPAAAANPYREVSDKDFNMRPGIGTPIEVNAYYRYGAVFGRLLGDDFDNRQELRLAAFDIAAHLLAEFDLMSGLCGDEYYMAFLKSDILRGIFGSQNAGRLRQFSPRQTKLVLAELLRLYKAGTSVTMFAQLMREMYPQSIVYFDTEYGRELLVYVGLRETERFRSQVELLVEMFIPADYDVKLFWELHFGLIGVDETMGIGEIMMY